MTDRPETALIFGVTGQDGAYLACRLLQKGMTVIGTCRDVERSDLWRLRRLGVLEQIDLRSCPFEGTSSVSELLSSEAPDYVFNLAGVTSLAEANADPELCRFANGELVGVMLESAFDANPSARFFQASSSQIFGAAHSSPQTILSDRAPGNVYAEAKCGADEFVSEARKHGSFAVSGILYNHESPLRTEAFISRKIVAGLSGLAKGQGDALLLGNLDAVRDWSFAGDIVEGIHRSLICDVPRDYILASGIARTVRDWADEAASCLEMELIWEGRGLEQRASCGQTGRPLIAISPDFYQGETGVDMVGDIEATMRQLDWTPQTSFTSLVKLMVEAETSSGHG
ncbi:GDP-mannose 4,6-dehydratase [Ponticaulis sp.]|uniref:GDP-mannose 4,6-dehydratase n=1 Tax=Ponticaulis sp. TaxID=2020902 RepID=UPI0025E41A5B|nr:GDP-mannose 4,6-dehydratase [Ponticaulis sp.]|tara:strand:- start:120123 stop:121148 length:1026 start_codon:yes stop_codon:yes gene_type:complete